MRASVSGGTRGKRGDTSSTLTIAPQTVHAASPAQRPAHVPLPTAHAAALTLCTHHSMAQSQPHVLLFLASQVPLQGRGSAGQCRAVQGSAGAEQWRRWAALLWAIWQRCARSRASAHSCAVLACGGALLAAAGAPASPSPSLVMICLPFPLLSPLASSWHTCVRRRS